MKSKLEMIANLVIIVTGISATAFLANRYFDGPDAPALQRDVYQPGELLAADLPIRVSDAERTLLVVVNSRCSFCTASMPFYRRLVKEHAGGAQIAVVGTEPLATLQEYIVKNGLGDLPLGSVRSDYFKTRLTPLLVLIDKERRVVSSWPGKLGPTREKEVIGRLSETASRAVASK